MQLGDLGAEVIKVERPGSGDDTRAWGPPFLAGESAYYLCCNRNKQSVTVNLKSDIGRQVVRDLAARSDVLVENFLPGTLDSWGLGESELRSVNPRLVFCSITGFGQTGPRSHEPGYDILIQALGGVMSFTGEPDGPPTKLGVAIADITAGMFACQSILASLLLRERTGAGERIDIALFDSTLAWLANVGQNFLATGIPPQRLGSQHPNIVPYQQFAVRDGSIILAVGNDEQFRRFCGVISRPDLASDSRFTTNAARVENRSVLLPILVETLAAWDRTELLKALDAKRIPCGPVHTLDETFAEPQVAARGLLRTAAHPTIGPLEMVASPLRTGDPGSMPFLPPPRLGEHTDAVLTHVLGYGAAEIARLRSLGAV